MDIFLLSKTGLLCLHDRAFFSLSKPDLLFKLDLKKTRLVWLNKLTSPRCTFPADLRWQSVGVVVGRPEHLQMASDLEDLVLREVAPARRLLAQLEEKVFPLVEVVGFCNKKRVFPLLPCVNRTATLTVAWACFALLRVHLQVLAQRFVVRRTRYVEQRLTQQIFLQQTRECRVLTWDFVSDSNEFKRSEFLLIILFLVSFYS